MFFFLLTAVSGDTPDAAKIIRIRHNLPFQLNQPRRILKGEKFSFFCEASPKYFATGNAGYVKFGLLYSNGSTSIMNGIKIDSTFDL